MLLDDVKNELGITSDDEGVNKRLNGYLARGQNRLNEIAGNTLDFEAEGEPKRLLLDYCRYANSQALEVFEINFASDLLSLHLNNQVEVIPDEDKDTDGVSDV